MPIPPATATKTSKELPGSKKPRFWLYFAPPLLCVIAYLFIVNLRANWQGLESDPAPISGTRAAAPIAGEVLSEVPALISAGMRGEPGSVKIAAARLLEPNHAIYLALRRDGLLLADGWRENGTVGEGLADLAADLVKYRPGAREANTAEVCFAHSYRQIDRDRRTALSNIHRGLRGLAVETSRGVRRMSPTTMLAFNQDFNRAIDYLVKDAGMNNNDVADDSIRTFECDQLLVLLDRGLTVEMFRGNEVVPVSSVNRESTAAFAAGMASWLLHHLQIDGRMTYKWWPSRGAESQGNNMIRQWMATAALGKLGHDRNDATIFELAAKNINYNLSQFYRRDDSGHGYILFNRKAKLGAMALAAYSILIHPQRANWAAIEASILKTIYSLQLPSGRYYTFYVPRSRHDNENFYPGETQLYLATRYAMEGAKDGELLRRIMSCFRFYRQWHRDNRNPAFIPWHTQAYYTLWEQTRDGKLSASDNQELVDFVFEMNDWLVDTMQQWDDAKTPDARGRFFSTRHRYGPPHASATGVYLEGLIDAYKMARTLGDDAHRLKYVRAMVRGIRSSMQLQFVDEIDMYYISKRDEARGGLRTTIYDNEIRVDNVQHTMMGVLKIVRELTDEEWAYGRGE